MVSASNKEETELQVCPYLRQMEADWLSMDAGGFYCCGHRRRIKVLHSGERLTLCEYPNFTSCSEYQIQEGEKDKGRF